MKTHKILISLLVITQVISVCIFYFIFTPKVKFKDRIIIKHDSIYSAYQVFMPTIPNHIDSVNNYVKQRFSVFYWTDCKNGVMTDTVRMKHYMNFCD